MPLTLDRAPYGGWRDSLRLGNGSIELIATTEIGPRIAHLGLADGRNLFCEVAADRGATGGDSWRMIGGHRLWHAPEDAGRTYAPDNDPIAVERRGDAVALLQPRERSTGIAKSIELRMHPELPWVRVTHRLHNGGVWPVRLAPWALSVMAAGGSALVPLPPRGSHPEHLVPASTLALWRYTDLSDERWGWGKRAVSLRQVPGAGPQKLGLDVPDGWAAYLLDGTLFLKLFTRPEGAEYPDLGSSVEIFTNDFMLELETLGPLQTLPRGGEALHREDWFVFGDAHTASDPDAAYAQLLPFVERARAHTATEPD